MLAADIRRVAQARDIEFIGMDLPELDITKPETIEAALLEHHPDVVINCAAYTNVDAAESDSETAELVNAVGAGNLAVATCKAELPLIQLSTDYVFDGTKTVPYVESDQVGPQSVYGVTKLGGEERVEANNHRHFIVRTSWLFGVDGNNFVETMLKLAGEHDELTVVSDQIGCPTWTGHLAEALLDLASSEAYGKHHVVASGVGSWYDFAVEIFNQTGTEITVKPVTTDQFPRPAKRPAYSVMRSERSDGPKPLPEWTEGLRNYLAARTTEVTS